MNFLNYKIGTHTYLKITRIFLAVFVSIVITFAPFSSLVFFLPDKVKAPIEKVAEKTGLEIKEVNAASITDDIILFYNPASASSDVNTGWPSGGGTLSSDWTCISCSGGAYDNYFPVGSTSFGTGGSKTHATGATLSNSNASVANASGGSGGNPSATAHNHGLSVSDATSNYPKHGRLMMIKYTGADPLTELPDNVIAMFDGAPPAGWTTLTTWDDRIIIATASADGTGNGSDTHSHTMTWGSLTAASETINEDTGSATSNTATHTHTAPTASTTDTRLHVPQHGSLIFATTNGTVSDFTSVIAMFDATPDSGYWTVKSGSGGVLENDFIEASTSYSASPGGSNTHTHANVTSGASGQASNNTVSVDNGSGSAEVLHTHTITATMPASIANGPPYKGVIFAECDQAACAAASITVSGTCKQSDQSTACTAGSKVVRVAVNGSLQAQTDTTIVSGDWSISSVTQPTAGQIVTIFIETEGASSSQAVAVTEWSSGDVTGVELIESHLTVGSNQNTTISNSELADYDSGDSGKRIFYDVAEATSVLTVDADSALSADELYIASGDNFTPGGNIFADDVEIFGTFDLGSNTASVSGTWDDNGTFTAGTSKIEMTGTAETLDASTFYQLEINPSSAGTITASGSFTISNTLDVASGDTLSIPSALTLSGSTLTLTGTISGAGTATITNTAGTISGGGTISNLTIDPSSAGTVTLSSALTVSGTLTIASGDTFKINSGNTLTLSGTGTPLSISGTFSPEGTSTVVYSGSSANITATTYKNLTLGGTGTYTLPASSNITMVGNLAITIGSTVASSSESRFIFGKGGSQTVTDSTASLQNLGEIIVRASTSNTTLTTSSNVRVASATIEASQILTNSNTLTINEVHATNAVLKVDGTVTNTGTITMLSTGTGALAGSGTYTNDTNSTLNYKGSTLTVTTFDADASGNTVNYTGNGISGILVTTYHHLGLKPSGASQQILSSGTYTVNGDLTIGDGTNQGATAEANDSIFSVTGDITVAVGATFTLGTGNLGGTGDLIINGTLDSTDFASINIGGVTKGSIIGTGTVSIAGAVALWAGGTRTFGTTSGSNNWSFRYLYFRECCGTSGTVNTNTGGAGTITVGPNFLTIGAVGDVNPTTLNAGNRSWILSNILSPIAFNASSILIPDASTFTYTGATANVASTSFKHLILGGTGTYTMPSLGNTTLLGDLTIANGANIASGSSTIIFKRGGTQTLTDNNTNKRNLGEIAVRASTSNTTLTLSSDVRIASATIDASQTLDANGSKTLTITGTGNSLTASGSFGTFTRSTGTVVFAGNGTTTIPTLDYYNLKLQPPNTGLVSHVFGSGTASVSNTFTIGGVGTGTFTVSAATNNSGVDVASISISALSGFTADNNQEFAVSGNFINNGTFSANSGTVTFENSRTSSISGIGPITFNNFTSTTPNKKIKFQAGKVINFAGTVTLTGAVNNLIRIESTASGSQWYTNFSGAQSGTITYVRVESSGCQGGTAKATLDGTSSNQGNNGTCWFETTLPYLGPGVTFSDGGQSGGGSAQTGGGQGGGGGGTGVEGGSGGGGGQGGGGQGGGGGGSPVMFDPNWLLGNILWAYDYSAAILLLTIMILTMLTVLYVERRIES